MNKEHMKELSMKHEKTYYGFEFVLNAYDCEGYRKGKLYSFASEDLLVEWLCSLYNRRYCYRVPVHRRCLPFGWHFEDAVPLVSRSEYEAGKKRKVAKKKKKLGARIFPAHKPRPGTLTVLWWAAGYWRTLKVASLSSGDIWRYEVSTPSLRLRKRAGLLKNGAKKG